MRKEEAERHLEDKQKAAEKKAMEKARLAK